MTRTLFSAAVFALALAAQSPDIAGPWELTITRYGDPDYGRLTVESKDGKYTARIRGLTFEGTRQAGALELQCSYEEDKQTKQCGTMKLHLEGGILKGEGNIFDGPLLWSGRRPTPRPEGHKVHDFEPKEFHHHFSGSIEPALHIFPGDTVRTKTVDAGGVDGAGVHRTTGGNPETGPFYVEGAMPGDTIAIHFNRIRLNRDTAGMYSDSIAGSALSPYYFKDQKPPEKWDSMWKLDRERGTATLSKPSEKLKNFTIRLQPMLGCVGVAPPGKQAFRSGNLGNYGGNMDYNQIREGVTLYMPVFQPGAILFVGDGHAAQGDGELTGNALETSMDVEFTVDLIEGKSLGQPRAEDAEYIMVMGIAGSLNEALQSATTGLARWLSNNYKLNSAEVAMVLGSSMRYDIAEVVDPQVHVVAKIRKELLQQIPQ